MRALRLQDYHSYATILRNVSPKYKVRILELPRHSTTLTSHIIAYYWNTKTLPRRLELPTLMSTASRSNQLSYGSHGVIATLIKLSTSAHLLWQTRRQENQTIYKYSLTAIIRLSLNFATARCVATASLAYLAEHPLSKREVVGSNPTGGSLIIHREYKSFMCLPTRGRMRAAGHGDIHLWRRLRKFEHC